MFKSRLAWILFSYIIQFFLFSIKANQNPREASGIENYSRYEVRFLSTLKGAIWSILWGYTVGKIQGNKKNYKNTFSPIGALFTLIENKKIWKIYENNIHAHRDLNMGGRIQNPEF